MRFCNNDINIVYANDDDNGVDGSSTNIDNDYVGCDDDDNINNSDNDNDDNNVMLLEVVMMVIMFMMTTIVLGVIMTIQYY